VGRRPRRCLWSLRTSWRRWSGHRRKKKKRSIVWTISSRIWKMSMIFWSCRRSSSKKTPTDNCKEMIRIKGSSHLFRSALPSKINLSPWIKRALSVSPKKKVQPSKRTSKLSSRHPSKLVRKADSPQPILTDRSLVILSLRLRKRGRAP